MLVNKVTLSTCSTYVTFQRTTIAESVLSLSRKNVDFKERNHRKATGVAFLGRVSADCIIIVGIFANRNKKKEKKMVDRQKRQQQSLRVETAGAHHSITFVQKKKKKSSQTTHKKRATSTSTTTTNRFNLLRALVLGLFCRSCRSKHDNALRGGAVKAIKATNHRDGVRGKVRLVKSPEGRAGW